MDEIIKSVDIVIIHVQHLILETFKKVKSNSDMVTIKSHLILKLVKMNLRR
jgi:hypothetical protein